MDVSTKIALWFAVGVPVAIGMELWAALLHGRVWHGLLWPVHKSHHAPRGRLEANDILSFTHAPIAIVLILYGCLAEPGWVREVAFGVGLGMTAFGFAYIVVHDGLVHGRLPVGFLERWPYMQRVRAAHRVHHTRHGGPYGLFLGPWVLDRTDGPGWPGDPRAAGSPTPPR